MKFLHKPSSSSLCFFIVLFLVCVVSNVALCIIHTHVSSDNLNDVMQLILTIIYLALPICYLLIAVLFLLYLILCIEKICCFIPTPYYFKISSFLSCLDILIGIAMLFSLGKLNESAFSSRLSDFYQSLFYFNSFHFSDKLSSASSLWGSISLFFFIAFPFVLFVSAARKAKHRKQLKQIEAKQTLTKDINSSLGFEYSKCDFYQQVKIPYMNLQQTDGTRGEFEAYRALVQDGLEDATYVFNREIPKEDGLFTELDLIVVHPHGIIVIENKHYTTRIFGNATDHDLTIIDHGGNKKAIYNPIKQNENHVAALKAYLQPLDLYVNDELTPIHSVVVFTASWNDKTDDIISGINPSGTSSKICTSQNLSLVVKKLLSSYSCIASINASSVSNTLLSLSIRRKIT